MVQSDHVTLPPDSLYLWMYRQGLKGTDFEMILKACVSEGRDLRQKDIANYWNGYYRRKLYAEDPWVLARNDKPEIKWDQLQPHPYIGMPEIEQRYVPCNASNKPLIKWSRGCMTLNDASLYPGKVYLAENLKGTKLMVIDCDGDHGDEIDTQTVMFLSKFKSMTHTLSKDNGVSFHLTFSVDRLVPTRHFPHAHIDIIGNRVNSLRYFKTKRWNGLQPMPMTSDIWDELHEFCERRKANGRDIV